jgi:hypothetical protein
LLDLKNWEGDTSSLMLLRICNYTSQAAQILDVLAIQTDILYVHLKNSRILKHSF